MLSHVLNEITAKTHYFKLLLEWRKQKSTHTMALQCKEFHAEGRAQSKWAHGGTCKHT